VKRRTIYWDTETALIRAGLLIPPMTCMSFADPSTGKGGVVDRHDAHAMMRDWLRDSTIRLVGHNLAFDVAVMCAEFPDLLPLFFAAYDDGRLEDTMLNEQLLDIAEGHFRWDVDPLTDKITRKNYSLGALIPGLDKQTYRYGYGKLRDVPVTSWETGYLRYALDDAIATMKLDEQQRTKRWGKEEPIPDTTAQARAAFALHLMSAWGMRTDEPKTLWLEKQLEESVRQLSAELVSRGLLRENGSRDMSLIRARIEQSGAVLTYTPTGQISTSSEALKAAADTDPDLDFLILYAEHLKLLTTYIPALKQGIDVPINARFNTLVETGRTSCSAPNLQNLPRGKKIDTDLAHHVREAFVPRKGFLYSACDYDTLEIRTLGQVLWETVGGRTLRDAYQADPDFDPHTRLAAQIAGVSYEDGIRLKKSKDKTFADYRQMSKAGNFGYGGGMGANKMRTYAAKGYGVELTLAQAKKLRDDWMRSLPEISRYLEQIGAMVEAHQGKLTIKQLRSGRIRGNVGYTDCANGYFQGLASDGAKAALWDVTKACYNPSSKLYGSRPVCFIHDEIICEVPADPQTAHDAAIEQEQIMCRAMERFTPEIPIRASPALMRRWYKGADRAFDAAGRLTAWEPR
jgi:DNA polymerase-1